MQSSRLTKLESHGPRTKFYYYLFIIVTFNYDFARLALAKPLIKNWHWKTHFCHAIPTHTHIHTHMEERRKKQEQPRNTYIDFKLIRNGQFECCITFCCCTRDTPKPLNVLLWCHSFNISRWFQTQFITFNYCITPAKRILAAFVSHFYLFIHFFFLN